MREGHGHLFPVNQWQHVAFVADGSMLRVYRQGREVGSAKCEGVAFPVKSQALAIGLTADDSGEPATKFPGYWSGRIDDILIFNRALSAADIKKLAAAPP